MIRPKGSVTKDCPPEINPAFGAHPVDGGQKYAIGHRMAPLDRLPGIMLGFTGVQWLVVEAADSGGAKKKMGTFEGGQSGRFGEPLVPTDQNAETAIGRGVALETQVPGRKVKLLVVVGIVGMCIFRYRPTISPPMPMMTVVL